MRGVALKRRVLCYRCVMFIDVVDLRNFYAQSLGIVARRFVGQGIRAHWNEVRGERIAGIGYTTPYMGIFREEAERCLAFMPASQGVVKWPSNRPGLAALVDETELPLTDAAVDRRTDLEASARARQFDVQLAEDSGHLGCITHFISPL